MLLYQTVFRRTGARLGLGREEMGKRMKEQKCIYPLFLRFLLLGALCLLAVAPPVLAQTSFPMIGGVYPVGVQRGKTVDVTVYAGGNGGANLYGAYKALVEGVGVKAEVIVPEKGWPAKPAPDPKAPQKVWELPGVSEVKLRVTVAPDAPLGVRELRLGTARMGISSVGLLVVSDETQVSEAEPNNDIEHAQNVTLPCDVNGRIQQGEDIDCYKFTVTAGQEVTFAVQCARLMDKIHDLQEHADPLIVLRDLKGLELARNDDYYRADPLLHYKFDKAGQYVIQIRDVNYSGNPFWIYRLNITSRPYVVAAVPCAVRPGQSAELHVTGFNLGGANTAHIDVPANAPSGVWTTSLKLPNGMSNPISLLVSDVPQTVAVSRPAANLATANNGASKTVTASLVNTPVAPVAAAFSAFTLPGGVSSAILTAGQSDHYKFQAKKGTAWGFEVTARRLDSEMDSELKLRDAKGNVLATNDDAFGKDFAPRLDVSRRRRVYARYPRPDRTRRADLLL